MKAEDIHLKPLIEGSKQFIIPVFQRDYSWTEDQCEQLWKDIERIGAQSKERVHFIGSVVYIAAEESSAKLTRWLVIDGQQRLTTLTLILIALRDFLEDHPTEGNSLSQQIEHEFLINQYGEGEQRQKLRLRRSDNETLEWLLLPPKKRAETKKPLELSDRLVENYEDFKSRLNATNSVIIETGLNRLLLVLVKLIRGEDDPQMIFESLNSTGLDLTPGDLVRNFVLMREEEKRQTKLYEEYWRPIEQSFGKSYREHFDKFLNSYLVIMTEQNKTIKSSEVYPEFNNYFFDAVEKKSIEEELLELKRHAEFYSRYVLGREENKALAKSFERLRIQVDVAVPLVMKLYSIYEDQKMNEKDFVEAIDLTESYVFRRNICSMQTRSLGNIVAALSNKIEPDHALESLKVAFKLRNENQKFPTDEEFKQALLTADMFHLWNCKNLLSRLENHQTKEPVSTATYTIEHIMPQNENLKSEWKEMLGEGWQETQVTWLHRLGNLTLTGYNSEYSDRPFEEKKAITGGFNESPLRLNKFMRDVDVWTEREMQQRAEVLTSMALKEWPRLVVSTEAVNKTKLKELKRKNSKYSMHTLPIGEKVKELFSRLRTRILALDDSLVEVFHKKSVTFRHYDFVVEVIPRVRRMTLVFNIEYEQLENSSEKLRNTDSYSYIKHGSESGGVIMSVENEEDIELALEVVQRTIASFKSEFLGQMGAAQSY